MDVYFARQCQCAQICSDGFPDASMARPSISISVCGDVIKQTSVHRHLGLHLDECLTWSAQVSHVTSKASQRIGLLHRLCHKLFSVVIRAIYLATVQSITDYASLVWGQVFEKMTLFGWSGSIVVLPTSNLAPSWLTMSVMSCS